MRFLITISGPSIDRVNMLPIGCMLERLKKTVEMWRNLSAGFPDVYIIVSGGRGFRNERPLASSTIMKNYLVSSGIPHFRIIEDPLARTTIENAINSLKIIDMCEKNEGLMRVQDNESSEDNYETAFECWGPVNEVCVVTSEFHLARTKMIFDHYINKTRPEILTSYIGSPDGIHEEESKQQRIKEAMIMDNLMTKGFPVTM